MVQPRGGTGLAADQLAAAVLGVERPVVHLDRHQAVHARLFRLVDRAHATGADAIEDHVLPAVDGLSDEVVGHPQIVPEDALLSLSRCGHRAYRARQRAPR